MKHPNETPTPGLKTYFPLILIFSCLIGFVCLSQPRARPFDWMGAMNHFMGGFYLAFAFFKLLNLRGFSDAYRKYDVVAKRFPLYGYVYPFIELSLGISYVMRTAPLVTNIIGLLVMSVSGVGVLNSLLKKDPIRCACLGTALNLPMSKITLIEDVLMVGMSAVMIGALS